MEIKSFKEKNSSSDDIIQMQGQGYIPHSFVQNKAIQGLWLWSAAMVGVEEVVRQSMLGIGGETPTSSFGLFDWIVILMIKMKVKKINHQGHFIGHDK